MKKYLLITILMIFPIIGMAQDLVIKTSYDSYYIDNISRTMVYIDDLTNTKTNYKISDFQIEPKVGFKIMATLGREDYLFDVYSVDGVQYITKYHRTYAEGSNVLLFETALGKIDFSEFYDYYSRNLGSGIEINNLSGNAADAYRNESMKYLNGIKSGNVTKLNSDRTFTMTNLTGYRDYRNWNPKIKKGSIWKGTSDSYIIDDDYARNLAIGDLTDTLMKWSPVQNDSSKKQWVRIIRSKIKSIHEE